VTLNIVLYCFWGTCHSCTDSIEHSQRFRITYQSNGSTA